MTTIVWDGETLASDGLSTQCGVKVNYSAVKISKIKGIYNSERVLAVGVAGDGGYIESIEKWIADGCNSKEFPEGLDVSIILITDSSEYFCCNEVPVFRKTKGNQAIGSGFDFAVSALEFGCNAVEAVKHACKFDVYSGGKIRKMKLR